MGSFGFLWVPLGSSGFLWVSLGFSGFLWVPLDLLNGFKSVFLLSFLGVLGGLYGMPTLWGSLGSITFCGHVGLNGYSVLFLSEDRNALVSKTVFIKLK